MSQYQLKYKSFGNSAILIEWPQKIAKEIIKGINKQSPKNYQLSKSSQKVLEKIIDLKLATIILFREAKNLNNLEKSLWGDMLQ